VQVEEVEEVLVPLIITQIIMHMVVEIGIEWGRDTLNGCTGCWTNLPGGDGGTNTGGGGGGGAHYNSNNKGGNGGSGIVIIRYKFK